MRSQYEADLQREWNKMSYKQKREKLRQTSMDMEREKDYKSYSTIHGELVQTIDGGWRFKTRIRNDDWKDKRIEEQDGK